jgi:hypothetical protein
MQFQHLKTLPGSPQPEDIFEPHMPGVDLLSDMDSFFIQVRKLLEAENSEIFVQSTGISMLIPPEHAIQATPKGQRHAAVITPGRMISLVPAPAPNTKSEKELASIKSILPGEAPLQITAISYTNLEAYMKDETKTKCIPFLGFLAAFAYIGHNVIVFEGHPSALEAGVRNSDALIIDSGMLPFMAENWADTVFKAMNPNPKIFIHDRKSFQLLSVARKDGPPGWRFSTPDGELSYINELLMVVAKARNKTQVVRIVSGQPLPSPKEYTTNVEELEYISTFPFRYEKLDADKIMNALWNKGQYTSFGDHFRSIKSFHVKLVESGHEARIVTFQLKRTKTRDGKRQMEIKLLWVR